MWFHVLRQCSTTKRTRATFWGSSVPETTSDFDPETEDASVRPLKASTRAPRFAATSAFITFEGKASFWRASHEGLRRAKLAAPPESPVDLE